MSRRERSKAIRRGDFVLIDIWAKLASGRADAVFYDITWTGVVDREPTEREQTVFETVRERGTRRWRGAGGVCGGVRLPDGRRMMLRAR